MFRNRSGLNLEAAQLQQLERLCGTAQVEQLERICGVRANNRGESGEDSEMVEATDDDERNEEGMDVEEFMQGLSLNQPDGEISTHACSHNIHVAQVATSDPTSRLTEDQLTSTLSVPDVQLTSTVSVPDVQSTLSILEDQSTFSVPDVQFGTEGIDTATFDGLVLMFKSLFCIF